MTTISNQLQASAFVSPPQIEVRSFPSSPIEAAGVTNPQVTLPAVSKPIGTPYHRKPDSLTVIAIPPTGEDKHIAGWCVKSVILVQLSRTRRQAVATTWLEGLAEYGTGQSDHEAISDLVASLGEYRESLEKRRRKLGASARRELACLRKLVERSSGSSGLPGTP